MNVDENVYEAPYSEATFLLGEIHRMILKATHAMDKRRWNEIPVEFGNRYEVTEFGVFMCLPASV